MEKGRFNELMGKFPNWVNQSNAHEVFTFFDGHYTHKGGVGVPDEASEYRLEDNEESLKIELASSGRRYIVQEDRRQDLPIIQLLPTDATEDSALFLVPKV